MKLIIIMYKIIARIIFFIKNLFFNVVFKVHLFCQGVKFEKKCKTFGAIPKILINRKSCGVYFGCGVIFNNYQNIGWLSKCYVRVEPNARLVIGDYSGLNGVCIFCSNEIQIGKFVKIGGGTRISDSNHHSLDYLERRLDSDPEKVKKKKIVIEDDAFIGAGCFIGKGVVIGARSIVAQGSVVVKDIPPDCIAGGNPCKVIKSLDAKAGV